MITMATTHSLLTLLTFLVTFAPGISDRRSSVDALLRELPNPDVMPLPQEGRGPLEVNIGLKLIKIIGVYKYSEEMLVLVQLSMQWSSRELSLNGNEYWSNNTELSLPTKNLWLPDITVHNAVTRAEVITPEVATLSSGGSVVFVQKLTQRVSCDNHDMDTESGATCTLRLTSWAHSNKTLSLTTPEPTIDLTEYRSTRLHEILSTSAYKRTKEFPCCPGIVTFAPGIADRRSSVDALLRELPNPDVMPLPQEGSGPLEVNIGLSLIKIIYARIYSEEIEVLVHLSMQWRSRKLSLIGSEYWSNNTDLVLPIKNLWLPDITVDNAVARAEVISPEVATLYFDGSVVFVQKLAQHVSCDVRNLTTESGATCTLKFASWAHNNKTLSLTTREPTIDLTEYIPTRSNEILSTSASKDIKESPCCPGIGWDEILFTLVVRSTD